MRLCLSALLLSICAAAQAADAGSAQKVFIDHETGERRAPTGQELEAQRSSTGAVTKPDAMPTAERTTDGFKIYRLGPAQRSALQAHRTQADGPLRVEHGDHIESER